MTALIPHNRQFSFVQRPTPIPGDLRIAWRLAITMLMLGNSRKYRASLPKLHVLNDAVRSAASRVTLVAILDDRVPAMDWQPRVEPAFGRALNFVVAEGFADWVQSAGRAGLQLTKAGVAAFEVISAQEEALIEERLFLASAAAKLTETQVTKLLKLGRSG